MNQETAVLNDRIRAGLREVGLPQTVADTVTESYARLTLSQVDTVVAVQALAECPNTYCNLPYSHYGPCRIIRAD